MAAWLNLFLLIGLSRVTQLRSLQPPFPRDKVNLQLPIQRVRNAVQHRQGMTAIVRILKPGNHRLRRPYPFRQLLLG